MQLTQTTHSSGDDAQQDGSVRDPETGWNEKEMEDTHVQSQWLYLSPLLQVQQCKSSIFAVYYLKCNIVSLSICPTLTPAHLSLHIQMSKPDGQLLISSITKVEANAAKGADFPFEIHFKSKPMLGPSNSPWVLNASSNVSVLIMQLLTSPTVGTEFVILECS